MKITFGLVIHNEESFIRRCLDSIKDVADEILIVHDGNCSDKTLDIAKEYTNAIFIREYLGGSDPHRLFILKEACNDLVFMIDADEFLSSELKAALLKLDLSGCSVGAFKWPMWDGDAYITSTNYKPCLFKKQDCWAIALHNFPIKTNKKICNFEYVLEHKPKEANVGFGLFFGKLDARISRDANRFALGYDTLEKYNEYLIPRNFKKWFQDYLKHPLFYAYLNLFKYFFGSYKNLYKNGRIGLILSMQLAFYQYKLGLNIWKTKSK